MAKVSTVNPEYEGYDLSFRTVLGVYFKFFRFARPYYPHLILISALMLIQVPVNQLEAFIIRDVTDQALLGTDRTTEERLQLIAAIFGLRTILWFLGDALWKFRELLNWYLFMRGTFDLRLAFTEHLHRLPMSFLRRRPPGEHYFRSTSDIMTNHNDPFDLGLMGMIAWTVLPIMETLYTLGWTIFFLTLVDPLIAWAIALYAIPYGLANHWGIGIQRRIFGRLAETSTLETAVMRDTVGGMRTLKVLGRLLLQRRVMGSLLRWVAKARLQYALSGMMTNDIILWTVRWGFTCGIHIYFAHRVVTGQATIGEWLAVFLIVERGRQPIESLMGSIQSIRIWTVNGQRVLQTLEVPVTLEDPPNATKLGRLEGTIEFDDVTLEYEPGKPALRGVTLAIRPGESVGLVGPSGAGKSSLLNLLLRLYGPTTGDVRVDGVSVSQVNIKSFLDQVAVVPQTTFLYDGTIADNIRFGEPKATPAEIEAALRRADAGPLLDGLAEGIEYVVGDATTLSGGERQRIGIARALIRDPRLVVLDEATANLDPVTEQSILDTLQRVFENRTSIIVAHRLKAVSRCTRIVVLEAGQVVDEGTHEELLGRGGWYARMWADQQAGRNLEEGQDG